MKIVRLSGGLANQMFQYILYKYLEIHTDDICYLDTSYFTKPEVPHNGLEIDKIFNIRPLWFHDLFSPEAWVTAAAELNGCRFHRNAESLGIKINVITDDGSIRVYIKYDGRENLYNIPSSEDGHFNVRSIEFVGHCYYSGYWLTDTFFNDIQDIMHKEFSFPKLDERNQKFADDMASCPSIGIHVRRGTFVDIGFAVPPEYFARPVSTIKRSVRNPVFYFFSEDLEWCKENLKNMSISAKDEVVFVSGNTGTKSFRDMQLMTHCKNLIRSPRSTFSLMAEILNRNPHRIPLGSKYMF